MEKYSYLRDFLLKIYEQWDNYTDIEKETKYNFYISEVRKKAYKNIGIAQYDLAQHYDTMGVFGNPNPFYNSNKMFYWYKKSAMNGYIYAYNNLADLYERGEGCTKNTHKALSMYELGMKKGDILAKNNYKLLKKELRNEKNISN